jgi:hypothetical protein
MVPGDRITEKRTTEMKVLKEVGVEIDLDELTGAIKIFGKDTRYMGRNFGPRHTDYCASNLAAAFGLRITNTVTNL